jgi:hypothetical protein
MKQGEASIPLPRKLQNRCFSLLLTPIGSFLRESLSYIAYTTD